MEKRALKWNFLLFISLISILLKCLTTANFKNQGKDMSGTKAKLAIASIKRIMPKKAN